MFHACVEQCERAVVDEPLLWRAAGWEGDAARPPTAHELWRAVIALLDPGATAS